MLLIKDKLVLTIIENLLIVVKLNNGIILLFFKEIIKNSKYPFSNQNFLQKEEFFSNIHDYNLLNKFNKID